MDTTAPTRYRIWYRTGGTLNYEWKPTTTVDTDEVAVTRSGTDLRRAGYPTITLPTDGPRPIGFDPEGIRHYVSWPAAAGGPVS